MSHFIVESNMERINKVNDILIRYSTSALVSCVSISLLTPYTRAQTCPACTSTPDFVSVYIDTMYDMMEQLPVITTCGDGKKLDVDENIAISTITEGMEADATAYVRRVVS